MNGRMLAAYMNRGWEIWAQFWGIAAPVLILAFAIMQSFYGDDAVIVALGPPRGFPTQAHAGQDIVYTIDTNRIEACPGEVVNVWTQVIHGSPVIISTRRPVANPMPGTFIDNKTVVQIPSAVTPGKWKFQSSVDSRCPTKQRLDNVVPDQLIEILP